MSPREVDPVAAVAGALTVVTVVLVAHLHRLDARLDQLERQQPAVVVHTVTTRDVSLPARASRSTTRHPGPVSTGTSNRSHGPDFAALAQCESSGNPRAVSPSGKYRGLYQFDLPTWRSVGGTGDPAQATPAEQTKRARLLYADRGRAPWPVCGRHL